MVCIPEWFVQNDFVSLPTVVETVPGWAHDVTNVVKCHDGQMQDQQHCPDCNSLSHCQTINLALDQQIPTLSGSPFLELSSYKNTAYQARHLAGYWQEILRPPRT